MADTTISAESGIVTVIYVFTCAEQHQPQLIAAIERATTEVFMRRPGFIAGSIHASRDRTRVVNYAQWASADHFDALAGDPEAQDHQAQIMAVAESADPRLFDVRAVHKA